MEWWLGGLVGFEVLVACELIVANWVLLNSGVRTGFAMKNADGVSPIQRVKS